MVVVMPRLAEGDPGEPPDVPRLVLDPEPARADEVAHGVDRPGDVVEQEDPDHAAPEERLQAGADCAAPEPAGDEREQKRQEHPECEPARDEDHAAVCEQVLRVLRPLRPADVPEEPADMRVPEAGDLATQPRIEACVRRVRIALPVGEAVVLAVVGDPADHRALHGHRAEHGKAVADALVGLVRPVREEPVKADRDPERRQRVADREDDEVAPGHVLAPEEEDRREEAGERDRDAEQVRDLLTPAHVQLGGEFAHGAQSSSDSGRRAVSLPSAVRPE